MPTPTEPQASRSAQTQPLSWNEIAIRATAFAKDWANAYSEDAEAKPFWEAFFHVFGVQRRKVASFEQRVHKLGERQGKIDLLWKGQLLIEHKSRGQDLKRAYQQAIDYFPGLKPEELPRYVLVCDFERFELHDLEAPAGQNAVHRFTLAQLPQRIRLFAFIAGYTTRPVREDDPINQRAVEAIGDLHDALKQDNYSGPKLEVFLVRLLFCLFADDTGIFQPKDSFHDLIEFHTQSDGSDVGTVLDELFATLNEKPTQRQKRLAEHFARFPYVNGKLFEVQHRPPVFDSALREQLLGLCRLNWGAISPAIFGAMFQTVIALDSAQRRRQLGAHYTSEANILKLLGPLFLDELRQEFEHVKGHKNQLFAFHQKLRRLSFLDPACGCGNFLVITYRALRELELDVLRAASQFGQRIGSVFEFLQVNVDQFYGIEIEEFPAQIAQVAMWLTDHQMNLRAGVEFGEHIARIPLTQSALIRHANALDIDWAELVPPERLSFILGNPPFLGKKERSAAQKQAMAAVTVGVQGAGVLDFVAAWYIKAAQYISATPGGFAGIAARANKGRKQFADVRFGQAPTAPAPNAWGDLFVNADQAETQARRAVRCAFVSTNSICQGEQVGVLWGWMLAQGIHIQFAHRTFQWSNEAPGKAAVHCIVVGFGMEPPSAQRPARLFDYADVKGAAHEIAANNLNPYLIDAPTIVLPNRKDPICKVNPIKEGSALIDGGHFLITQEQVRMLENTTPALGNHIAPLLNGDDFLNDGMKWALWLKNASPNLLNSHPLIQERLSAVQKYRKSSTREATQKLALQPALFGEIRQPTSSYLFIPKTSSESRLFIPIGFMGPEVLINNTSLFIDNATLYEFGILSSTMHNAWVRYTCGRLESRYRYSAGIVYNNYPWPQDVRDSTRQAIEAAAQAVLDARAQHQSGSDRTSLATLYHPNTMPANLSAAHKALDKAVDAAYSLHAASAGQAATSSAPVTAPSTAPSATPSKARFKTDAQRVAFLFTLYQQLTQLV